MNLADYTFIELRNKLHRIMKQNDMSRLRDMLHGEGMPALGGNREPAELLIHALQLSSGVEIPKSSFAELYATQINLEADQLKELLAVKSIKDVPGRGYTTPLTSKSYYYNAFLLAAFLPRNKKLFNALCRFQDLDINPPIFNLGAGRIGKQLQRALCQHQTDDRLKDYWLEILQNHKKEWDVARRTELLEAWRGLIWLPVSGQHSLPVGIDTLNQGLLHLHDRVADQPEAIQMLRLALRRLNEAVPLDKRSWAKAFEIVSPGWSKLLKDAANTVWPVPETIVNLAIDWPAVPEGINQGFGKIPKQPQHGSISRGEKYKIEPVHKNILIAKTLTRSELTKAVRLRRHLKTTKKQGHSRVILKPKIKI